MNTYNPPSTDPPDMPPEAEAQAATDLIRAKLVRIYEEEPDARQESAEAEAVPRRSKHQQFMYDLTSSSKDLATVQTAWHNYYQGLPPEEKHQVWQEFYASQSSLTGQGTPAIPSPQAVAEHKQQAAVQPRVRDTRTTYQVQNAIRNSVTTQGKLTAKHHLQSLLFGLGLGTVVVFIFLFGFFNEVFISPFIQPSRANADTPIILSSGSVAPTTTPEVIIPKINVEIPVDYSETTTNEVAIENDLESGVVHYPTTVLPGQNGNAAFFGHSSNNIFNQGKYKFAFVLLHTLVNGDTFYLTYNDKVYVYQVISHTIVSPNDVGVLGSVAGQTATATLITCDPPGTSINRLVVVGKQISPDPSTNTAAAPVASSSSNTTTTLPGNGPTLWSRFIGTAFGKLLAVAALAGIALMVVWQFAKPRTAF